MAPTRVRSNVWLVLFMCVTVLVHLPREICFSPGNDEVAVEWHEALSEGIGKRNINSAENTGDISTGISERRLGRCAQHLLRETTCRAIGPIASALYCSL